VHTEHVKFHMERFHLPWGMIDIPTIFDWPPHALYVRPPFLKCNVLAVGGVLL
jgi:hypothetical protein